MWRGKEAEKEEEEEEEEPASLFFQRKREGGSKACIQAPPPAPVLCATACDTHKRTRYSQIYYIAEKQHFIDSAEGGSGPLC